MQKKKIGHQARKKRRKQSLIDLLNLSSKETFLVQTVGALVLALMTQEIMRSTWCAVQY